MSLDGYWNGSENFGKKNNNVEVEKNSIKL